ncbi:MAG: AmmeMemoRadiSam system protein B [Chitinispirillales bacterium]|jgi:AmmeMemoRadiSam system protein B/AmmeMemoRadiSam system protein A|nr:AmmeMemoRadiSam system protein B [Chitinispirillales bacterium]
MSTDKKIRKPAVAGQFYPSSPEELREEVEGYLANETASLPHVDLMIVPHAGYVFSAPVAAKAYARISPNTKTVILIGPSHHKRFNGVHITNADYYRTPLGDVEVNQKIVKKLRSNPLCTAMLDIEEPEHCLEVHLPFLQTLLGDKFSIVPILTGKVNPNFVSEMLLPLLNDTTLVIASSDLSHYQPQSQARMIDDATVSTIVSGNVEGFMESCGDTAMRIAMEIAVKKGLTASPLDVRTSYETAPQYGDSNRVVGYASIAFVKPDATNNDNDNDSDNSDDDFTSEEKKYMLELARKTIEATLNGKDMPASTQPDMPKLSQNYGCFVTLNTSGHLRGCIGNIEPIRPLYKSVIENAISAAFHDPRFPEVKADELDAITIEVSVLTKPQPLKHTSPEDLLSKLTPFEHGVILKFSSSRQSTFLPQVWEQLPNKVLFLERLSMKAGVGKDDWKHAEVWIYRAVCFSE